MTGIIWAIWHLPLILFADYASSDIPLLNAILFTMTILGSSIFMGWQRQRTGSVWPAALTHGAHNTWIQVIYPAFIKKGSLDPYFGGESGIFLAIVYSVVGIYLYKNQLGTKGV